MSKKKLIIWGLAAVAVVVLAGVGVQQVYLSRSAANAVDQTKLPDATNSSSSQAPQSNSQAPQLKAGGMPEGGPPMMFPPGDIAQILGMTSEELQTQLKAGTTLEQIAGKKGMTLDQIKEKWLANTKAELDNQVSQGKLTAEQAQSMITRMRNTDLSKLGAGPEAPPNSNQHN